MESVRSNRPTLLIWDYDGTLASSLDQIISSFQAAFEYGLGHPVSSQEIVSWFGPTDEEVIRRRVPTERLAGAVRIFYEQYRLLQAEASLFVPVALLEATAQKVRHALVTNKGRMTTAIALKTQHLQNVLSAVVTGDDVDRPKPDPDGIQAVLDWLATEPRSAVYIGDSPTDVQAAQRAGIRVAAVTYGGIHSRQDLLRMEPTWMIDTPQALASWLSGLL